MPSQVELTILCDNRAVEPLQAEHGLAIWIHAPELTLLLDCGCGDTLLSNAEAMAIHPRYCGLVMLSHGHYDHSGGLEALWQSGCCCPILMCCYPATVAIPAGQCAPLACPPMLRRSYGCCPMPWFIGITRHNG